MVFFTKKLSLLEIIIALVILSIAMFPLFDILSQTNRSVSFLKEDMAALFVAKRVTEILKHEGSRDFDNLNTGTPGQRFPLVNKNGQQSRFFDSTQNMWLQDPSYALLPQNGSLYGQFESFEIQVDVVNDPEDFAQKPMKSGKIMLKKITVTVWYKIPGWEEDRKTEICTLLSR